MSGSRGLPAVRIRYLACSCAATLMLLVLAGCGGGQTATSDSPTPTVVPNRPSPTVGGEPRTTGSAPPAPPSPTAGIPARLVADLQAGRALVQAQCAACHALADAGLSGASPPIAPVLDGIGRRRARKWLEVQLVNPCAHPRAGGGAFSCSRMPAYGGLTQQQRDQVVQYLLSRR